MKRLQAELHFLRGLITLNLASAMEYRAAFISSIAGMFLNNGIYFVFWLLFFDRFGSVRGYEFSDVYLLFAVVALAVGLGMTFAGNIGWSLATLIAQGKLDYYLVMPRQLLPHVIFSRMGIYAIGDIVFGLVAFLFAGRLNPTDILLFLLTAVMGALIYAAYGIVSGSLAFFMGNAQNASQQMTNGIITFALYPNTLFTGATRLLLFTLIPAGFIGAVPVKIIQEHDFAQLGMLLLAVVVSWVVATIVFHQGLRRYESGSAINVNI